MTARVGAMPIHGLGGTQYDLGAMYEILKKSEWKRTPSPCRATARSRRN